jgi:hypothetical protein
MMQIKLAKACRRREAGAPMTVTERAAYRMMITGDVRPDPAFMAAFEAQHGIRPAAEPEPTKQAKPAAKAPKTWTRRGKKEKTK